MHAGPHLCGQTMDLPQSDFWFCRNAKFSYVYDMSCRWEHELRVEARMSVASAKGKYRRFRSQLSQSLPFRNRREDCAMTSVVSDSFSIWTCLSTTSNWFSLPAGFRRLRRIGAR